MKARRRRAFERSEVAFVLEKKRRDSLFRCVVLRMDRKKKKRRKEKERSGEIQEGSKAGTTPRRKKKIRSSLRRWKKWPKMGRSSSYELHLLLSLPKSFARSDVFVFHACMHCMQRSLFEVYVHQRTNRRQASSLRPPRAWWSWSLEHHRPPHISSSSSLLTLFFIVFSFARISHTTHAWERWTDTSSSCQKTYMHALTLSIYIYYIYYR